MPTYSLRLTKSQHEQLKTHLMPEDGCEAVALALCGRAVTEDRHIFIAREIVPIPYSACSVRTADRVTWPTEFVEPLVRKAYGRGQAILKFHSHRANYPQFSSLDDESDDLLFSSISSLLSDGLPHASVIMLPDGRPIGRVVRDGVEFLPMASISVVGDEIAVWHEEPYATGTMATKRNEQVFGTGTIGRLKKLSAAVVGCSGTGSIVVEQLARMGIGRLVLVDPDVIEEKNLNRVLNSGKEDAYLGKPKVFAMASAVARMGLGQELLPLPINLVSQRAVREVAACDVIFGCTDGAEARHLLNRIAAFYTVPYFDVGVRLDADGEGGIANISGAVHYLQPGGSSLLSREVYTMADVEAEELRRTNPEMYRARRDEGYIRGIREDRPAVISVNMFFASLVVQEFLARLHPFRNQPNTAYAAVRANLLEPFIITELDGAPCAVFARHVGRGDAVPLLDRPDLS
jgi:ThiF family